MNGSLCRNLPLALRLLAGRQLALVGLEVCRSRGKPDWQFFRVVNAAGKRPIGGRQVRQGEVNAAIAFPLV
jgi:hypothetical protein